MLYNGSIEVVSLTFNAIGTDKSSWFSQNNLVQSPWTDLKAATNLQAFSIEGDSRMFEISYKYGGCPNDNGWFLITEQDCDWEKHHPAASILYSKLDHKVNYNQYGMKIILTLHAIRSLIVDDEQCVFTSLIDCPFAFLDFMRIRECY